ncbi:hypothetical protein BX600DRAFT_112767 [Xylariales sp. PMI_506]|nr:hypothetical protein BX600DRAFT_112767 [Xylariales sp. PMI_506]
MGSELPILRWGILGTGWISTMFVTDLLISRPDAPVKHIVTALGTSSQEKGTAFIEKVWKDSSAHKPHVYDHYQGVYDANDVDIVYVGTPHSLHKQNCLDAIAVGKNVLCEKPFTINESEAQEVIDAAKSKNVFIMEAMWTRFIPLMQALQDHLHVKKTIGSIQRCFVDFGMPMHLLNPPTRSRLKDPSLGAGALLDIGIYTLMYASAVMGGGNLGQEHPPFDVSSFLNLADGIDEQDCIVLRYPANEAVGMGARTAICTATLQAKNPTPFARIEGSDGVITLSGPGPSLPREIRIEKPVKLGDAESQAEAQVLKFEPPSSAAGFLYEADAVGLDLASGRKENETMPLDETIRMMKLMDTVRKQNGLEYPQDKI